jgi:fermentation-respiration switch protein FrsA (DUF1100 family)
MRVLHLIESKLTFKPNSVDHGGLAGFHFDRVRFGHESGFNLDGIFYSGSPDRVVLFIHGNRHNITKFSDHYTLFRQLGLSFFAFDYPGYGTSAGTPSEPALYASARVAFNYLTTQRNIPEENIIVYGCSLGGAVASELVQHVRPAALLTESTFTNSTEIARHLYPYLPLWLITPTRFRNDLRFPRLSVPTMIIHGDADHIVPVSMAHNLFSTLQVPKQLAIIEGANHINSLAVGDAALQENIARFFGEHCSTRNS